MHNSMPSGRYGSSWPDEDYGCLWSSRGYGRPEPTGRIAVWAIGLILIITGIASLYLSYSDAAGWWQGTLQAMGVGLFIAGLVDVITISSLESIVRNAEEQQRRAEEEAMKRLKLAREQKDTNFAMRIINAVRPSASFDNKATEIAYYVEQYWDNPGVRNALLKNVDLTLRHEARRRLEQRLGSEALQELDASNDALRVMS